MKLGLAQINTTVGDLPGNFEKILAAYRQAVEAGADLVLTPELAVTGYPPQDLLFKPRFVPASLESLQRLQAEIGAAPLLVGFVAPREPGEAGPPFHNAAAFLQAGLPAQIVYKSLLPTYDEFDEARYFRAAARTAPVVWNGRKLGVTICEDIWTGPYLSRPRYDFDPVGSLVAQGAEMILNLSASPFQCGKPRRRFEMIADLGEKYGVPFVFCNAVGGNDELIFDGHSCVFDTRGQPLRLLPGFLEQVAVVDLDGPAVPMPPLPEESEELRPALVLGLRDYYQKCGFKSAVLALDGGVDSAVTAVLAVEALGAENVTAVVMPGPQSSKGSVADALALAGTLGVRCLQVPVSEPFEALKRQLATAFAGLAEDGAEDNMQARLRGTVLFSLSSKFGSLLLTSGNKSELAVGHCTLHGDTSGGLAVISDVPKTSVYRLAGYLNRDKEIIPLSALEKPPGAELRPDQNSADALPSYDLLDQILQGYVEENLSALEIIGKGFDPTTVRWVQRRVDLNAYKRTQAPPGLKVTSRAFGSGRRLPIAQRFVE